MIYDISLIYEKDRLYIRHIFKYSRKFHNSFSLENESKIIIPRFFTFARGIFYLFFFFNHDFRNTRYNKEEEKRPRGRSLPRLPFKA